MGSEGQRRQDSKKFVVSRTLKGLSTWGRLGLEGFCYSCAQLYSLVDQFGLGRSRRGFSLSSSVSSLITRLGVILCLHLSSLLLKLSFYC